MLTDRDYPFANQMYEGETPEEYANNALCAFIDSHKGRRSVLSAPAYQFAKSEWYGSSGILAVGEALMFEHVLDVHALEWVFQAAVWMEVQHRHNGDTACRAYQKVAEECNERLQEDYDSMRLQEAEGETLERR